MQQEEIIKGNKLIAEFIGLYAGKTASKDTLYNIQSLPEITIPVGSSGVNATVQTRLLFAKDIQLVFNSDWRWLMTVVEKIETMQDDNGEIGVEITGSWCKIDSNGEYINDIAYGDADTKIKSVFDAVVEFVKYYNINKDGFKSKQ